MGMIVTKTAIVSAAILSNSLFPLHTTVIAEMQNEPVLHIWHVNESGWWFENEDGSYPQSCFAEINGETYYFNSEGYMVTGWQYIEDNWFFFKDSGAMKKNEWEEVYYLKDTGAMASDEWIDEDHYVGGNGIWIEHYGVPHWQQNSIGWWYDEDGYGHYPSGVFLEIDGKMYYFDDRGYMVTGWQYIEDNWFFFKDSGAMKKNEWEDVYYLKDTGAMAVKEWVQDHKYYVDSNGKWVKDYGKPRWVKSGSGWKYDRGEDDFIVSQYAVIDGQTFCFDEEGFMMTGWKKFSDGWHYFRPSGSMLKGWFKDGNNWYYLDESGIMRTGWFKVKNTWYCFRPSGSMVTGWFKDGNNWYYLADDGHMCTGWIRLNWYWYYLDSSGAMKTGKQYVNGRWYHFSESSGVWDEPEGDPKFYRPDSILILANKKHKLSDGYEPSDLVIPDVRRTGSNPYLRSEAADALEDMFYAAASDGVYLVLGSGYRSQSTQEAIYNNYVARDGRSAADTYSARPGYSEHQTGLAVDISDYYGTHYLYQSFENTAEARWLYNNAHRFGFIMRYPKGKEHITGYMYEPWHFRYVGVSAAKAIYNSGLTFEEYYGVNGGDY